MTAQVVAHYSNPCPVIAVYFAPLAQYPAHPFRKLVWKAGAETVVANKDWAGYLLQE
jgi:hypothetical protein